MPPWIATAAQFVADVIVDVYQLVTLKRPVEKMKARKEAKVHRPHKHISGCRCKSCEGKHHVGK